MAEKKVSARSKLQGAPDPAPLPEGSQAHLAWYCLRSQPKSEHIAAAHLRALNNVEVYCPRIRFRRMRGKTASWVTEALFPGYLFGRFDREISQKAVTYAKGVSGIVRFGQNLAVVADGTVAELRSLISGTEIHTLPTPEIQEGDSVVVATGVFQGLETLVTRAIPASERVRILLEILGDCREAEVSRQDLIKEGRHLLVRR